jgi:hypothetical protein
VGFQNVGGGIGSGDACSIPRDVGQFLFDRKRTAEIKDAYDEHDKQRERYRKLDDLRALSVYKPVPSVRCGGRMLAREPH